MTILFAVMNRGCIYYQMLQQKVGETTLVFSYSNGIYKAAHHEGIKQSFFLHHYLNQLKWHSLHQTFANSF